MANPGCDEEMYGNEWFYCQPAAAAPPSAALCSETCQFTQDQECGMHSRLTLDACQTQAPLMPPQCLSVPCPRCLRQMMEGRVLLGRTARWAPIAQIAGTGALCHPPHPCPSAAARVASSVTIKSAVCTPGFMSNDP